MKRIIALTILFAAVASVALAQGADLGEGLGLLGDSLSSAFKRFGTQIAEASKDMYESVKDAVEQNGPEIAEGVGAWVSETTPKVTGFLTGLWDDIKGIVK